MDLVMAQFRRRLPPMQEPPYAMSSVERANRNLVGSVVTRIDGRHAWIPHLAEMLLLCNEASKRCAPAASVHPPT
jgi:hypothetical protein